MNYKCESCNMVFNGHTPYQMHMKSTKHLKKTENFEKMQVNNEKMQVITEKLNISDPYVKKYGSEFQCILCCTTLNSIQQVEAHVTGKKHLSLITKRTSQKVFGISELSSHQSKKIELYSFNFHGFKIENPMSDVKIFDVDDPISF